MVRDRADRDVTNKKMSKRRQWAVLQDGGVFDMHGRKRVEVDVNTPHGRIPASTYDYNSEHCSVDYSAMLRNFAWPTFTAQTAMGLPLEGSLLRMCFEEDKYGEAENCWKSNFVRSGTVLKAKDIPLYHLVVGCVAAVGLIVWDLEEVITDSPHMPIDRQIKLRT